MKISKLFIPAVVGGLFTFAVGYPIAASAQTGGPSKPGFVCQELTGWDMSQTRDAGHYKVVPFPSGLKIWTDDASSQAKVAGYKPAGDGANLSNMGTPAINWDGTSPAPGLQIVLDIPGGTGWDGVLVGESVYGDNWWLSNSAVQELKDKAPHTGGGHGSAYYGTLAEWNTALEGQGWVSLVGFSLGSGVKGSGVIKSLTFRGEKLTFPCIAPTKSATATPTATATATPTATATATASATPTATASATPTATATPSTSVPPTSAAPSTSVTASAPGTGTPSADPEIPVGNSTDLPVTGSKPVLWILGGLALISVGAVLMLVARRRAMNQP